jgi:hypothetical protein
MVVSCFWSPISGGQFQGFRWVALLDDRLGLATVRNGFGELVAFGYRLLGAKCDRSKIRVVAELAEGRNQLRILMREKN